MRHIFILFFLVAISANAQMGQDEFNDAMDIVKGDDQNQAVATIASLEKKYPNTAEVYFLKGFNDFRDGNDSAALAGFTNAIKARPDFLIPYKFRALIFADKGLYDKAIADVTAALEQDPTNTDFINMRAGYYYRTQQFKEGLADIEMRIKLDPSYAISYFDGATFSIAADPNANVDSYFERAYAEKSIDKEIVDLLFGRFLLSQNRFEEAKVKYDGIMPTLEKEQGHEDLQDAAIVYYKTKEYDKAIKYYNMAITLAPNNVDYRNNLSGVYETQGDWQKLKANAELALAVDSENAYSNMYMAIALQKTGDEEKAAEYQAKAKRISENQ